MDLPCGSRLKLQILCEESWLSPGYIQYVDRYLLQNDMNIFSINIFVLCLGPHHCMAWFFPPRFDGIFFVNKVKLFSMRLKSVQAEFEHPIWQWSEFNKYFFFLSKIITPKQYECSLKSAWHPILYLKCKERALGRQ